MNLYKSAYWTKWAISLYVIIFLLDVTVGVRINKLQVPEVTHIGSPVILDCDYSWEETKDEGIVVKWYFNEEKIPVYQWIATKKPQVLGILKGRLNLEYSVSQDKNSKHRALHITKPGPDLSGDYTCLVSSFNNEDRRTKSMLVFVPEKNLDLRQERIGEEVLQVLCSAEGVFPKPDMSLLMGSSEVNGSLVTVEERDGLFDIKARANIPALISPEEFSCELRIPKANYTVRKEAVYYPGAYGTALAPSGFLLFAILCSKGIFLLKG
ncbi:hypothetical protein PPYR_11441 [Photinus pyralis]|uniref:Ig-like domain-containing protein n=1 Tax=Photinus pyralis TaxID=7054 RepID=A0A5N4ABA8_PHOPY|nr:uncharacterized protein LOC116176864 [Photinus pyralis]KAB0794602.1 hypothetical protein PPYR_11441 [Photinus pyralis]